MLVSPYIKHLDAVETLAGIGFYSWLGWMGALSYCIILSKDAKDAEERIESQAGDLG